MPEKQKIEGEYQEFMNRPVKVITVGRVTHGSGGVNVEDSLQLEGILSRENDTQIFLKGMKTGLATTSLPVKSTYGAVSKGKIIALYLEGAKK